MHKMLHHVFVFLFRMAVIPHPNVHALLPPTGAKRNHTKVHDKMWLLVHRNM